MLLKHRAARRAGERARIAAGPLRRPARPCGRRPPRPGAVSIVPRRRRRDRVRGAVGGESFATLRFGDEERTPAIFSPGGHRVLRAFPSNASRAKEDHRIIAGTGSHGDVAGLDFWRPGCRIVVREHGDERGHDPLRGRLDRTERRVATETRTMRFSETPGVAGSISTRASLPATNCSATPRKAPRHSPCPHAAGRGPRARGRLENADGLRDGDCWGRRSPRHRRGAGRRSARAGDHGGRDAGAGGTDPLACPEVRPARGILGRRARVRRPQRRGRPDPRSPVRRRIVVLAETGLRR